MTIIFAIVRAVQGNRGTAVERMLELNTWGIIQCNVSVLVACFILTRRIWIRDKDSIVKGLSVHRSTQGISSSTNWRRYLIFNRASGLSF